MKNRFVWWQNVPGIFMKAMTNSGKTVRISRIYLTGVHAKVADVKLTKKWLVIWQIIIILLYLCIQVFPSTREKTFVMNNFYSKLNEKLFR